MCARMMLLTRLSCNVSRCSMRHSDKLNPLSSKSDRNINVFKYIHDIYHDMVTIT